MKVKNDHGTKFSNLSNWKENALKKSGLQQVQTCDLREYWHDALPGELWSHTLGARSIFIGFISSHEEWNNVGRYEPSKLNLFPICDFIAQLVEHHTSTRGGHRLESHWSPEFFRLLSNSLNWKICCDDHSSLSYNSSVVNIRYINITYMVVKSNWQGLFRFH